MTTCLGPDSIQLKMEDQGPFSKLKKKKLTIDDIVDMYMHVHML